jgi:hypothetical protein
MSFPIPTFPLVGDVWTFPAKPSGGAASVTNIPFQLYVSSHELGAYLILATLGLSADWYVQIKTGEGGGYTFNRGDVIQPDNTIAEYYLHVWREHYYKGFPSQAYLGLMCVQCNANGTFPRTY